MITTGVLMGAGEKYRGSTPNPSEIIGFFPKTIGSSSNTVTKTSVTIPGTESDGRTVLIVGILLMADDGTVFDITNMTLNGYTMTVNTESGFSHPSSATTSFNTVPFAAYGNVPTGESGDLSITTDNQLNTGFLFSHLCSVDFGVPGIGTFPAAQVGASVVTGEIDNTDLEEAKSIEFYGAFWGETSNNGQTFSWEPSATLVSQSTDADFPDNSADTTPYGYAFTSAVFKDITENVFGNYDVTVLPDVRPGDGVMWGVKVGVRGGGR